MLFFTVRTSGARVRRDFMLGSGRKSTAYYLYVKKLLYRVILTSFPSNISCGLALFKIVDLTKFDLTGMCQITEIEELS